MRIRLITATPEYENDLGDVLRDQQHFPAGTRYDNESLRAAR